MDRGGPVFLPPHGPLPGLDFSGPARRNRDSFPDKVRSLPIYKGFLAEDFSKGFAGTSFVFLPPMFSKADLPVYAGFPSVWFFRDLSLRLLLLSGGFLGKPIVFSLWLFAPKNLSGSRRTFVVFFDRDFVRILVFRYFVEFFIKFYKVKGGNELTAQNRRV
jgi:hypothetical protein